MNKFTKVTNENIDELFNCEEDLEQLFIFDGLNYRPTLKYHSIYDLKSRFPYTNGEFCKRIGYKEIIREIEVVDGTGDSTIYKLDQNIVDISIDDDYIVVKYSTKESGDIDTIEINKRYVIKIFKTYKEIK